MWIENRGSTRGNTLKTNLKSFVTWQSFSYTSKIYLPLVNALRPFSTHPKGLTDRQVETNHRSSGQCRHLTFFHQCGASETRLKRVKKRFGSSTRKEIITPASTMADIKINPQKENDPDLCKRRKPSLKSAATEVGSLREDMWID
jgi:hypothetical protein